MIHAAFRHMLTARGASILLMVAFFALLGRLLDPASFGEYAIALAVFTVVRTVSEFGLRQYLVRAPEIGEELLASAAGMSAALTAALCAGTVLGALLLEGVILSPGIAAALMILAPALLIDPFVLATEARLQRDLDFRLLSVVEVLRTLVDGGTAVALAWQGYGAPALAAGMLAARLGTGALLLLLAGRRRRVRPRLGGWARFRAFGLRHLGIELLPHAGSLALISVLGSALGPAAAGLFNRADTIRTILDRTVLEGIQPVVLPALGKSLREGRDPLALYAFKVDCLAAICWPGFALIALLAPQLVAVMLGPDWEAAVLPVALLALSGAAMPFTKLSAKFFIAMDLMKDHLRIQATQQALRIAVGAPAALVSVEAFCAAVSALLCVKAWRIERVILRRLGAAGIGLGAIAARNLALTLATLAGPALLVHLLMPGGTALLALVLALPLAGAGWLAGLALTRHRLLPSILASAGLAGIAPAPGAPRG